MKNYTFYGILFTLSAYLCFLSACGEGEIIDLSSGSEWDEIKLATDNLTKGDNSLIAGCIKNPDSDPICNIEVPSSPSGGGETGGGETGGGETGGGETGNGETGGGETGGGETGGGETGGGETGGNSSSSNNTNANNSSSSNNTNANNSSSSNNTNANNSSSSNNTNANNSSSSNNTNANNSSSSNNTNANNSSSSNNTNANNNSSSSSDDPNNCEYEQSFCGDLNIATASEVTIASSSNISNLKNSGNCFFVADITSASQNDGSKLKVNGLTGCSNTSNCKSIAKKDGGYYINTTGNLEGGTSWAFSYGTPSCLQ